jgi:hypothetical protein
LAPLQIPLLALADPARGAAGLSQEVHVVRVYANSGPRNELYVSAADEFACPKLVDLHRLRAA